MDSITAEMVLTDTTSKFCSSVNSRSFTCASSGPCPDWKGPLEEGQGNGRVTRQTRQRPWPKNVRTTFSFL